jgi:hypothetical protein
LPSDIEALDGDGQTGVVGQKLTDSLVVRVTDSRDRPVAGQRVRFTAVSGGAPALLLPDTAVTDAEGKARSVWVLGGDAGQQTVEARVVSPVAGGELSTTFTAVAEAGGADTIVAVGGQGQTGIVNGLLQDSLVVMVTDRFGNPVPDQIVRWRVPEGEGGISSATTTTGENGRAGVTRTLGPEAGAQSARATCDGLAGQVVVFTHVAISGQPVDLVKLSPDQQSAPAGSTLPDPLVVQAQDAQGNGVPGQVITWRASSGGSVSPRSSITDGQGKASTSWTLSATAGPNTLTAAGFGATIDYTAVGTSGGLIATTTTITSDNPDPSVVGQSYTVAFRVGSFAGTPTGSVTVSDGSTSCSGTLAGGTGSCDLTSTSQGSKTLTANYAGDATFEASSTTEAHRVDPADPSSTGRLRFTVQPSTTQLGKEMKPPVEVSIVDSGGGLLDRADSVITLRLGHNPLGLASLAGPTSKRAHNGVAQFDKLKVQGLTGFSGLTLIASSPGMVDVESAPFDITLLPP